MRKVILIVAYLIIYINVYSQTSAKIFINKLTKDNGKLTVSYSILYSSPQEIFNISMIAKHKNGAPIIAKTFTGDMQNVKGGANKQFVWDFQSDGLFLDEEIDIQLKANPSIDYTYYSTPKLLLASTLMPGKGVTMLDKNKGHFMWTFSGYALAAGSVGLYFLSEHTFNSYQNSITLSERQYLFSQYKMQYYASGIAGLGAIAVWGINYVRVFTTKSMLKNTQFSYFNFYPQYDYRTNSSLMTFNYRF